MEFLILASAHFLALLSPGPDFFLIIRGGLKLPSRYAISICLGITTANTIYVFLAILGLESIKEISWIFSLLTYMGSLYLVYIGFLLVRNNKQDFSSKTSSNFLQAQSYRKQFIVGFLSAALNPKNIIFYFSLFTVLVSKETSLDMRILYGVWMAGIVFIWDVLIVALIGRNSFVQYLENHLWRIEKMTGVILLGFGLTFPFV
ncbi:LysE family translocator [Curvivirga aplysinae]|uniref:LysE family translocator n=1 Tax=Curvivirga aplysinae TaxID=2529852 RepID=UPI0012BCDFA5|nr:LysE family transporter [Curvivirga aplysinae]MTI10663.1 LysE family translocator [Curvivirga aplysinae]